MSGTIEQPLRNLGAVLPSPAKSVATYVPSVRTGNLLATSGQLPLKDGALVATGLLGVDLSTEEGQAAARSMNAPVEVEALVEVS